MLYNNKVNGYGVEFNLKVKCMYKYLKVALRVFYDQRTNLLNRFCQLKCVLFRLISISQKRILINVCKYTNYYGKLI
jgi:hypothetical protein